MQHYGSSGDKPWSYSTLTAFELCAMKFAAEKVFKTVKEVRGQATFQGQDGHSAFEHAVKDHKPLPMDLAHHQPVVDRFSAIPGEVLTEQRVAVNSALQPTGFFDADVWCRGVIDLIVHNSVEAAIIDWKFGKHMKPDFDQLDLMVALSMQLIPSLDTAMGIFYWAKHKKFTRKKYVRDDLGAIWSGFMPRVVRFQAAQKEKKFPPRANFLCRKHCLVTGCRYHSVGG